MNRTRLLLLAAALLPLGGCKWLDEKLGKITDPKEGGPLKPARAEQFVSYVNERAGRLQSIQYDQASMTVSAPNMVLSPTLRGWLAAGQPRKFNMVAEGAVAGKVILGSNDEQFWVYVNAPREKPVYVYASHTDFAAGHAKIPGIPFEPDWVMQALGMATLPEKNEYKVDVDQKARTYTLSWPATLPSGGPVVKEIVFDGDAATGTRPQVKRHVIRDPKGKVICFADVKQVKTAEVLQNDPRTGQQVKLPVQYPTRVVLKWEEQKFEMDLQLNGAQVNKPFTEAELRQNFTRPNIPDATPHNLAEYREPIPKQ